MFAAVTGVCDPAVGLSWLRPAPKREGEIRRELLAPGIWIITERQWWPASVLDTGVLAPVPEVEPVRRVLPFPPWHAQAACAGADPELFFGIEDADMATEPLALSGAALEQARAYCHRCPVARECLTWALTSRHHLSDGFLAVGERYGVWGGTTQRQRERQLWPRIRAGAEVEAVVDECLAR